MKKVAQVSGKAPYGKAPYQEESNEAHGQPVVAQVTEEENNRSAGANSETSQMDPKDLETQPEHWRVSQTRDEGTTNLYAEPTTQWELAKQLGMACGADQIKIIEKIAAMEIRDRKEAETMGNRSNLP